MAEKAKKTPKKPVEKKKPEVTDLPGKKYMRPDEVATYFGIARSTIYLWCEHGLLESWKPTDGTLRVTVESVRKLEKEGFARAIE